VIGPFPWDPFPPGEPEPKGPDPIQGLAYRSAVTAADAFRSVRLALRRESGTLRIGNRFVADGRYREAAFVAVGNAANSMALAALRTLGDRLTQGYVAGPEPVTAELPFRGVVVPPGWPGAPVAATVVAAAQEIAESLTEQDLFLLLLSPGALRALAGPPPGLTDDEFGRLLADAHAAGATGREVDRIARVLGTGGVGGQLAKYLTRSDAGTFVVDRGEGPSFVGGGPVRPVDPAERAEARATLARIGLLDRVPATSRDRLAPDPSAPAGPRPRARPVVVATPGDALRAAADSVFDKGWTSRLAFLEVRGEPRAAAEQFLGRTEELVRAEALTPKSRTKGVATFAMATLDAPEGVDEGPALGEFLAESQQLLRRREMSVGLFRTAGAIGSEAFPAGAVVGAPGDPEATVRPGFARAVPMRRGITDVGALAVALCRAPDAAPP
jgi:glycerate-2-kinase